jgi:putative membrane protein (TIGR04086 family)
MQNESVYGNTFFTVLKGAGVALAISFFFTVVLAGLLQVSVLSEKALYPINQVVKALAVTVGAVTQIRGEKGWIKGGALGVLFTSLSYLAFSAIGGDFSFGWLILVELLIAFVAGALGGSLGVNLRR